MEATLIFLWKCTFSQIILVASIENLLILIISILLGQIAVKTFNNRRVSFLPASIKTIEIVLVFSTLLINTLVTVCGWFLWKKGFIVIYISPSFWKVLLDLLMLFFIMDILMYLLHRVAHIKFLFPVLHKTHHNYQNVRPLTLFVLNPFETLSFGSLWLILICLYSASGISIFIYLTLNVLFGIMGHLGVEPVPSRIASLPFVNLFTTSTFHAQHHQIPEHNFGFYTTIWDKLFKSLSPFYRSHFGKTLDQ